MKTIKQILAIVVVLCGSSSAWAQSDLSFYHMGELTPQNSAFNPVFFPEANFYVSLPVLSGISTNMNNSFTYNDVFTSVEGTDSVRFDPEGLLSKMKSGDRLSFDANISLLQVGFHIGQAGAIQVFANERATSSFYYPKHMLEYILHGNGEFLDTQVTENNLRGGLSYFREFGVGYSHQLTIMGSKKLRVGLRVKYLQGFLQAQVDEDASVSFLTHADTYNVTISTNNPVFNTAGFDAIEDGSYLGGNPNKGFGVDIGADLEVTPKLKVALAINDLGSINWKEDVKNYELLESEATFGGLDLRDLDDAGDVLSDTLEQLFDYVETTSSFKSKLPTRIIASGAYQVIPNGTVTGTILTQNNLGKLNLTYGVGYTHKVGRILTVSTSVSKKPRQGFAIGGGFGARLGFAQFYTSIDNVIGFTDIRKMQNVNMRFGVNFLFGRFSRKEKEEKEAKEKVDKVKAVKDRLGPFPEEYNLGHLEDIQN